jgi:SET domain-containing protein
VTFVPAPVQIKRSPIHGRGVFARTALAAGTPVLEYVGERITPAEARRRYPEVAGAPQGTYLLRLDGKTTIDGSDPSNTARYVNHSCDPNAELLVYKKRVFLIASRAIAKGEELTYDYGLVIRGDVDLATAISATACACGAPVCRGTMLRVSE